MSFFSRLTDIVTCNISQLLAQAEDPQAVIAEIIREIAEMAEAEFGAVGGVIGIDARPCAAA